MSNFIVPNTFIPGTKAKAQEINENFSAIQDELNLKPEKNGDISQSFFIADATESNHAITKKQVETMICETQKEFLTSFCVESGYVDENGNSAIISAEDSNVTFNVDNGVVYAPIVAIPANKNAKFTVTNLESIDISSYSDGVYNVFVNSGNTAYLLKNTVYVQKIRPAEPTLNSVFENISKMPIVVEKYNGTTWELFNDVLLGSVVIEGGVVTEVVNKPFANSWSDVPSTAISSASAVRPVVIVENYVNGSSWYRVYSDGWCEQGGVNSEIGGASGYTTVELLKPYKDANYHVLFNQTSETFAINATKPNRDQIAALTTTFNKTVSSFIFYNCNARQGDVAWITYGYLA